MAFPAAQGHGSLPNGNFSPVIYSQKVQKTFRKASVVEDITNSDYFGEIESFGDSVRIIKEPEIVVSNYARGTQITPQDLTDEDFSLVIDKANYFAFKIDDIEAAHAHNNWMELASDRGAYRMRDTYDKDVLAYMSGWEYNSAGVLVARTSPAGTKADTTADNDELLASNKLTRSAFLSGGTGSHSVPMASAKNTNVVTPLQVLNRIQRFMDEQNIDQENRWVVFDPVFKELLMDEESKLVNADFVAGDANVLRNGRIMNGTLRNFRPYESNNIVKAGTGPGTVNSNGSADNYGILVAGHMSAVATAQQLTQTESYRDPNSFADIVRGMQLYGRKILRPEALFTVRYNLA